MDTIDCTTPYVVHGPSSAPSCNQTISLGGSWMAVASRGECLAYRLDNAIEVLNGSKSLELSELQRLGLKRLDLSLQGEFVPMDKYLCMFNPNTKRCTVYGTGGRWNNEPLVGLSHSYVVNLPHAYEKVRFAAVSADASHYAFVCSPRRFLFYSEKSGGTAPLKDCSIGEGGDVTGLCSFGSSCFLLSVRDIYPRLLAFDGEKLSEVAISEVVARFAEMESVSIEGLAACDDLIAVLAVSNDGVDAQVAICRIHEASGTLIPSLTLVSFSHADLYLPPEPAWTTGIGYITFATPDVVVASFGTCDSAIYLGFDGTTWHNYSMPEGKQLTCALSKVDDVSSCSVRGLTTSYIPRGLSVGQVTFHVFVALAQSDGSTAVHYIHLPEEHRRRDFKKLETFAVSDSPRRPMQASAVTATAAATATAAMGPATSSVNERISTGSENVFSVFSRPQNNSAVMDTSEMDVSITQKPLDTSSQMNLTMTGGVVPIESHSAVGGGATGRFSFSAQATNPSSGFGSLSTGFGSLSTATVPQAQTLGQASTQVPTQAQASAHPQSQSQQPASSTSGGGIFGSFGQSGSGAQGSGFGGFGSFGGAKPLNASSGFGGVNNSLTNAFKPPAANSGGAPSTTSSGIFASFSPGAAQPTLAPKEQVPGFSFGSLGGGAFGSSGGAFGQMGGAQPAPSANTAPAGNSVFGAFSSFGSGPSAGSQQGPANGTSLFGNAGGSAGHGGANVGSASGSDQKPPASIFGGFGAASGSKAETGAFGSKVETGAGGNKGSGTFGLFGSSSTAATAAAPFGSSAATSLGSSAATPFGSSAAGSFGAPAKSSGDSKASGDASPPSAVKSPGDVESKPVSLFGAAISKPVNSKPETNSTPPTSLFGAAPASGGSLFGSKPPESKPEAAKTTGATGLFGAGTSLFGGPSATAEQPRKTEDGPTSGAGGVSLFGSNSASTKVNPSSTTEAAATGLFGGSSGLFGAAPKSTSDDTAGSKLASGAFGAPPTQDKPGGIFGQTGGSSFSFGSKDASNKGTTGDSATSLAPESAAVAELKREFTSALESFKRGLASLIATAKSGDLHNARKAVKGCKAQVDEAEQTYFDSTAFAELASRTSFYKDGMRDLELEMDKLLASANEPIEGLADRGAVLDSLESCSMLDAARGLQLVYARHERIQSAVENCVSFIGKNKASFEPVPAPVPRVASLIESKPLLSGPSVQRSMEALKPIPSRPTCQVSSLKSSTQLSSESGMRVSLAQLLRGSTSLRSSTLNNLNQSKGVDDASMTTWQINKAVAEQSRELGSLTELVQSLEDSLLVSFRK